MKRLIIISTFLFINCLLYGQSNFTAAVLLAKNNVIYTNVDNPILLVANVPSSDINFTINGKGSIEKLDPDFLNIRVKEPGYYNVSLTQKSTGKTTTYTFRAKSLPIPFATISKISNDSISTHQILKAGELSLSYIPTFDIAIAAEVINFSILRIAKDGKRSILKNYGGKFSNDLIDMIKECAIDDILIFRQISAKGLDPVTLKIPDVIFYIK